MSRQQKKRKIQESIKILTETLENANLKWTIPQRLMLCKDVYNLQKELKKLSKDDQQEFEKENNIK